MRGMSVSTAPLKNKKMCEFKENNNFANNLCDWLKNIVKNNQTLPNILHNQHFCVCLCVCVCVCVCV